MCFPPLTLHCSSLLKKENFTDDCNIGYVESPPAGLPSSRSGKMVSWSWNPPATVEPPLDEDYFCRNASANAIAISLPACDPQAFAVVEKLLQGNPNFKNYQASLLDK
jgi:hypothetical protein